MEFNKDFLTVPNINIDFSEQIQEISRQTEEMTKDIHEQMEKRDNALFQTAQASEEQTQLLKQQLEFLQKQNREQAKELKRSHVFQWVSFGLALASIIATVIVAIVK